MTVARQIQMFPPANDGSKMQSTIDDERDAKTYRDTNRLLAHSPVAIRAPLNALPEIVASGSFRNQHESGTSRGTFSPDFRADDERESKGFLDHPVYGYLDTAWNENARVEHLGLETPTPTATSGTAQGYGEVKFVLTGVADRTTITQGDSLAAKITPPNLNDVRSGEVRVPNYFDRVTPSREANHRHGVMGYMEAQIHNPVGSVNQRSGARNSRVGLDHVHHVEVERPVGGLNPHQFHALKSLKDQGVPVSMRVKEHRYQPPLPYSDDELRDQGFYLSSNKYDDWMRHDGSGVEHDGSRFEDLPEEL